MSKVSTNLDFILQEIKTERDYQVRKWGNPIKDARVSTAYDFNTYLIKYMARAATVPYSDIHWGSYRDQMMKVATLAVAAIENSYVWEKK